MIAVESNDITSKITVRAISNSRVPPKPQDHGERIRNVESTDLATSQTGITIKWFRGDCRVTVTSALNVVTGAVAAFITKALPTSPPRCKGSGSERN
jgi:hypothetical protein